MIRPGLFLTLFLTFSSCDFSGVGGSSYSSQVSVVVAPYGAGDVVAPRNPAIFLSGGSFSCRPRTPQDEDWIEALEDYDLSDETLEEVFGVDIEEEETGGEGDASAGRSTRAEASSDPIRIEVGDNWLKLGLFIGNGTGNRAGEEGFFLVIDDLTFIGNARYRGQNLSYRHNLSSGYCETSSLYIIPPNRSIQYKPKSKNPFHNLTIYLSGFPIIDRIQEGGGEGGASSGGESGSPGGLGSAGLGSGGFGGLGRSQSGSNSLFDQIQNNLNNSLDATKISEDQLLVIPRYDVRMIMRGHFLTRDGSRVSEFVKRVGFTTQSSLEH